VLSLYLILAFMLLLVYSELALQRLSFGSPVENVDLEWELYRQRYDWPNVWHYYENGLS